MSSDQPPLPRPAPDPGYLLRLRERAFARMRQDEDAVAPTAAPAFDGPVTRRWTLQRMALAAAALTPAAGALQAAAAGFRNPAPQYGAPGIYTEPPAPVMPEVATHADLGDVASWKTSRSLLLSQPNETVWGTNTIAKAITYKLPSGAELGLSAVMTTQSPFSYVMDANISFYVLDGEDLYSGRFGVAELILTPSIYKVKQPEHGMEDLISKFAASMSDKQIAQATAPSREIHIPLTKGVPSDFWTDGAADRTRPFYPWMQTAGVKDGVLELSFSGPSNRHYGTFSIDLHSKKLVKFDGK